VQKLSFQVASRRVRESQQRQMKECQGGLAKNWGAWEWEIATDTVDHGLKNFVTSAE